MTRHLRGRYGHRVDGQIHTWLTGLSLGRHPGAFFASFREPDGNGLLAALHAAAFARFARAEGATFSSAHCAGDGLAGAFTVPAP